MIPHSRVASIVLTRTTTDISRPDPDRVVLTMTQSEAAMLRAIACVYDTEFPPDCSETLQFARWLVRKL